MLKKTLPTPQDGLRKIYSHVKHCCSALISSQYPQNMGIDAGFDMVPRLSRGTGDAQNWARFISVIKEYYKDDAQVETTPNYILFKAGEHPRLPFEGHKFLRFSSKVSGQIATESRAESYINTVTALAKASFGARIQYWHEASDQLGHYNWNEVNEPLKSYDEVWRELLFVCGSVHSF